MHTLNNCAPMGVVCIAGTSQTKSTNRCHMTLITALGNLAFKMPLLALFLVAFVILTFIFERWAYKSILYTPRCYDYGSAEILVWREVFYINLQIWLALNLAWFVGCMWVFVYVLGLYGLTK